MNIPVTVTRSALTVKECPPELADALAFVRTSISFATGDLERVPERVSYAQYDALARLCRTYPNALHLVHAAAQKLGLSLEVQDQRLRPSLDFDRVHRTDCPGDVYPLLETVAQSRSSGLLLVSADGDRTAVVCGLVRLLPEHFKILIAGSDQIAASQIRQSLARTLTGEKIGVHVRSTSARARIMVTCLDALKDFVQGDLAYSGYALRDFDAWICDEAHRLPESNRLAFLNQFRTVYSWGLTATPVRADNSHQLLSVIFGPVFCPHGREAFPFQAANSQPASASTRAFVFPLPASSIAENVPPRARERSAYLQNPALSATLRGIDVSLPETARVMVVVDSLRLAIILGRQLPRYLFLDSRQGPEQRHNALAKLRAGQIQRVIIHICSNRTDLPEVDYLIDCTFASNLIGGSARPTLSEGRRHTNHLMLLCLGCEQFFNEGIAKLEKMNALEWQVTYMFDRKLVEHLPFAKAPLLPELGTFPES